LPFSIGVFGDEGVGVVDLDGFFSKKCKSIVIDSSRLISDRIAPS
jgi:hypothetical protein